MEPDLNRYDLTHATTRHATMSHDELTAIYRRAWDLYYTPAHVETVLRRAKLWGYDTRRMMMKLLTFFAVAKIEGVHPLEGGVFRRKRRRERRPGLPLEGPLAFYAREVWSTLRKHTIFAAMYWRYRRILRRIEREGTPHDDVAMTPVQSSDFNELELFTATSAAKRVAAQQLRRIVTRARGDELRP
jgi:hypothetical protein